MFYYTNHSYMEAHQYVHIDVHSEYLIPECFITHIKAIWMLTSMYTLM